jgi:CRISPR-associated endonuclease/helicase Cas3
MSFAEFYRDKRNRDPFPWMMRLADRFLQADWPETVAIPTGCGKSEIVFVWAWARNQNAALPRRLWMVSDRRLIVDQTFDAACTLQPEVLVSRLRGGMPRNEADILNPIADQIISTTVDQFGSRLLFRAYGESPQSWPIWAGLAGCDSLVIVDEAHLSPVAEATFKRCQELGAKVTVISMTATPRQSGNVFQLDDDDEAHPVLGPRLRARRLVTLCKETNIAKAAAELIEEGAARIAVICNTVRDARAAFEAIWHPDKHLLIGRQRALDRDRLVESLLPRLKSGAEDGPPILLVSTQCIEAGADFDFDAMVSQACPIDALRQRLGRLDRLGKRGESRCLLVRPDGDFKQVPPYGAAPKATWDWLTKNAKKGQIDLGQQGWAAISDTVPDEARSAAPQPVTLIAPYLRMLSRTSPRPKVEPDIDLFLHGRGKAPGAISIIWREDVYMDDAEATDEILQIIPPDSLECCETPLWEAQAWLRGDTLAADLGDVEGGQISYRPAEAGGDVFRWLGREEGAELAPIAALRPGDVIIAPSARGGYDKFGWAPQSAAPVPDLCEEAYLLRTGRRIERFADPEAEVEGDRVHRWSRGVVVEHYTRARNGRGSEKEVTLERHQQAVSDQARHVGEQLRLDAEALAAAGLHHDDGKDTPGWQLHVNGGNLARLADPPLAKGPYQRSHLSRLPVRWRHEAESLRRLPADAPDLVRWLVATHHGYARPHWPIPDHGIGLAEMMQRLQAEHGFWGLANYEAALRCADRLTSKEEAENA